ncbi:hypothetical protein LCGC14_0859760 [marine sediment metagenome]|uniref:KTSC domain-containing protein n=1 Tax=marine sediment metagenome TaxID=412755 RepID=A0A0F9RSE0_9ZZZZ
MSTQSEGPVGDADHLIPWVPRISSRLTHISYREDRQVIYVRFHNGTEWQYEGCTLQEWEAFCGADSLGRHIHTDLNTYPNRPFIKARERAPRPQPPPPKDTKDGRVPPRPSLEERARVAGSVPESDRVGS